MKTLKITDLKDLQNVYIVPLDDNGKELSEEIQKGIVDLKGYKIKISGQYSLPIGIIDSLGGIKVYKRSKI